MSAAPTGNLLAAETSPYLLQHKDNPVAWRPWGPQALAEAKAQNKPVLLSIGYAACHWCHVMAEESFADPETAAQMNANFIPVKVDREERPDVDALYQNALTLMGQQSGWPATVFLTPDGDAYFGGTYFPKTDNGRGQPPFTQLLTDMARVFTEEPEKVAQNARVIREQLELMWPKQAGGPVNPNAMEPVSRRVTQRLDLFFGGFEGAPKFPQTPALHLVWRAFMRSAAPQFGNAVVLTLDNMSQGGIYDHLGGGFARYSTDERWLVPHFEKMLYDNALIVELMTLVWQHTRSPLYAARIDETIDWLLREMVTKDGAFAASLDADSEGVEGKYYVWTEAEIDAALGEGEAPLFKQVYSVTKEGNFEGKSILHRLGVPGFLRPDQEAVLTRHRRMLLLERAKRVRPNLDDKVLSDWNGLAIAALAQAGAVFRRPEWHFAAIRAFAAIDEKMTDGKILYHTYRDGKRQHEATAEGYAYMARAALILFELSSDPRYLDRARSWMARLDTAFRDRTTGGYFFSSAEQDDVPIRQKTAYDSATPNYHGVILEVLGRLRHLTGEGAYGESIEAIGNFFGGEVARNMTALNTFFAGLEYALAAVQIVIIGDDQQADTQNLVRAVLERSVPCRLLTVLRPGAKLPIGHPAQGKGQEGGKATAYVCQGGNCSPPVTDPNQLANGLLTEPFQRIMRQQAEAQAQVQQPQAANRR